MSSDAATSVNSARSRRRGDLSCPQRGVAESRSCTAHTTRNTTMRLPCRSSCERKPAGQRGPSGRARRTGRGARRGDSFHGSPPASAGGRPSTCSCTASVAERSNDGRAVACRRPGSRSTIDVEEPLHWSKPTTPRLEIARVHDVRRPTRRPPAQETAHAADGRSFPRIRSHQGIGAASSRTGVEQWTERENARQVRRLACRPHRAQATCAVSSASDKRSGLDPDRRRPYPHSGGRSDVRSAHRHPAHIGPALAS